MKMLPKHSFSAFQKRLICGNRKKDICRKKPYVYYHKATFDAFLESGKRVFWKVFHILIYPQTTAYYYENELKHQQRKPQSIR
jgi:hypothetical protein